MERYLGLDVHAASCTLAVVSQTGKRLKDLLVETNGQALVEATGRNDEAQRRLALGEKHLEGSLGVVYSNAQGLDGLDTHALLVLITIDQGHQKERHQRDQHQGSGCGATAGSVRMNPPDRGSA